MDRGCAASFLAGRRTVLPSIAMTPAWVIAATQATKQRWK
jgi:hypothetical protein